MKKGFTLIELLAVILILGIIALIAIPAVTNVIEDSKKGAAKTSALSYIKAINDNNALYKLEPNKYTEITSDDVENIDVNIKGKGPISGIVTIENGKVTEASLCVEGYTVVYNGREVTSITKGCSSSNEPEPSTPVVHKPSVTSVPGATHKGIVYMNPTDLTVECTASNSQIGTGSANESGCMKFYVFDNSGGTYKMILDHNTTAKVAWNSNGSNASMGEVATALSTDTTGWVGSPRLITANEIATITNTSTFDGSSSTWFFFNGTGNNKQTQASSSQGDNEYAWLFDYITGCTSYGCATAGSSTNGYWTSSTLSDYSGSAWRVRTSGTLNGNDVDDAGNFGVRPVIELSKSYFN